MALAMIAPMSQAGKRVMHWHADKDEASVAHADELSEAPLHASPRYYGGRQAFSVDQLVAQLASAGAKRCSTSRTPADVSWSRKRGVPRA